MSNALRPSWRPMSPLLAPYSEDVEDAATSRQLRDLLGAVLLLSAAGGVGEGLSRRNPATYTIAPGLAVNFPRRG
jgi:hypothetical protein